MQVRCVGVTADRTTIKAARLRKDIVPPGDSGPVVRDVLHHVPLGNNRDLDSPVSSSRGTRAIERAIDVLFAAEDLKPLERHPDGPSPVSCGRSPGSTRFAQRHRRRRHMVPRGSRDQCPDVMGYRPPHSGPARRDAKRGRTRLAGPVDVDPETKKIIGSGHEIDLVDLGERWTRAHVDIVLIATLSAKAGHAATWSRLGRSGGPDRRDDP